MLRVLIILVMMVGALYSVPTSSAQGWQVAVGVGKGAQSAKAAQKKINAESQRKINELSRRSAAAARNAKVNAKGVTLPSLKVEKHTPTMLNVDNLRILHTSIFDSSETPATDGDEVVATQEDEGGEYTDEELAAMWGEFSEREEKGRELGEKLLQVCVDNDSIGWSRLEKEAMESDSLLMPVGLQYLNRYLHNYLLEHPTDTNCISAYLILNPYTVPGTASALCSELYLKYFPLNDGETANDDSCGETDFEWKTTQLSNLTPGQLAAGRGIHSVAEIIRNEWLLEEEPIKLSFLDAMVSLQDEERYEAGVAEINRLSDVVASMDEENDRTALMAEYLTLARAWIAGHGLDYPEKAVEILEEGRTALGTVIFSPYKYDLDLIYAGYLEAAKQRITKGQ